jgi:hypothetical protein
MRRILDRNINVLYHIYSRYRLPASSLRNYEISRLILLSSLYVKNTLARHSSTSLKKTFYILSLCIFYYYAVRIEHNNKSKRGYVHISLSTTQKVDYISTRITERKTLENRNIDIFSNLSAFTWTHL